MAYSTTQRTLRSLHERLKLIKSFQKHPGLPQTVQYRASNRSPGVFCTYPEPFRGHARSRRSVEAPSASAILKRTFQAFQRRSLRRVWCSIGYERGVWSDRALTCAISQTRWCTTQNGPAHTRYELRDGVARACTWPVCEKLLAGWRRAGCWKWRDAARAAVLSHANTAGAREWGINRRHDRLSESVLFASIHPQTAAQHAFFVLASCRNAATRPRRPRSRFAQGTAQQRRSNTLYKMRIAARCAVCSQYCPATNCHKHLGPRRTTFSILHQTEQTKCRSKALDVMNKSYCSRNARRALYTSRASRESSAGRIASSPRGRSPGQGVLWAPGRPGRIWGVSRPEQPVRSAYRLLRCLGWVVVWDRGRDAMLRCLEPHCLSTLTLL